MSNILLITKGTAGDLFPFLRMGKDLKQRGNTVTVLSHWFLEEEAKRAGLNYVALDTPEDFPSYEEQIANKARNKDANFSGGAALFGNYSEMSAARGSAEKTNAPMMSAFGVSVPRAIAESKIIGQLCLAANSVIVSSYTAFIPAQTASEKTGTPLISLFPSPDLMPIWIMDLPFFEELYKYVGADINRVRAEVGLAPVSDWRAWLVSADRHVGAWPEWLIALDPNSSLKVEPTGFFWDDRVLSGEIPADVQEMLDGSKPAVLVCHGTSMPSKLEFMQMSAEACRLLGLRGILVTKYRELVPDELPEEVKWVSYLPFGKVMPKVAAVIHHGGFNTAAQALAAGVPQLVAALGHDRSQSAARVEALGVGESLLPTQWNPKAVARSLRRLIDSPAIKQRSKELADKFKEGVFGGRAYDLFEEVASGKGYEKPLPQTAQHEQPEAQPGARRASPETVDMLLGKLTPDKRALLKARLGERLGARLVERARDKAESAADQKTLFADESIPDRLNTGLAGPATFPVKQKREQ